MPESPQISIPYPLELLTGRLVLRSPEPEHAALMFDAVVESLPELRCWMPWAQNPPTLEKTAQAIERAIDQFRAQTAFRIHLFDRWTGQLVGSSGYPRIDFEVPMLEIGYWIRTSRINQGLCGEAVRALTDYALRALSAQRVEIRCDANNHRSWRVAQRAGFTLEGILRRDCLDCQGRPRDTRIYSMLPEEWNRVAQDGMTM